MFIWMAPGNPSLIFNYVTIGKSVYDLRIAEGLTQSNFALATGICERYINLIEHNIKQPTNKTLLKIAHAFNRDLTTFFSVSKNEYAYIFSPPGTYRIGDIDQQILLNEKRLYTYCYNLCKKQSDNAHNLKQQTITEALLYHYRYRYQCEFHVWLFSIAKNLHYATTRNDKRLTYIETYIETEEIVEDKRPDINLTRYIDSLAPRDKAIVKLRLSKLSYQQISAKLKIKPASAKSRFWKIKGRLKTLLSAENICY